MSLKSSILHNALNLDATERAKLAYRLLLSLEFEDTDSDTAQAWAIEIEKRAQSAETSKTPLSDWSGAIERIRASLKNPPDPLLPKAP